VHYNHLKRQRPQKTADCLLCRFPVAEEKEASANTAVLLLLEVSDNM
jgi:hypothetical protein